METPKKYEVYNINLVCRLIVISGTDQVVSKEFDWSLLPPQIRVGGFKTIFVDTVEYKEETPHLVVHKESGNL